METISREEVGLKSINDSEFRSRLSEDSRKAYDEKVKFWAENEYRYYKKEYIEGKVREIVPKMFWNAEKTSIEEKIWILIQDFYNGKGLYIWGKPGVGKTHLCSVMIKEYYQKTPSKRVYYNHAYNYEQIYAEYDPPPDLEMITIPDLFLKIKASFGRKDSTKDKWGEDIIESESQIIEYYSKTPILFLDDIGTEKTTDWAHQTLYAIIDYRYREIKQTVITSNLSLDELADKTGDRIVSRIAGMCKVIELKGKDRRI